MSPLPISRRPISRRAVIADLASAAALLIPAIAVAPIASAATTSRRAINIADMIGDLAYPLVRSHVRDHLFKIARPRDEWLIEGLPRSPDVLETDEAVLEQMFHQLVANAAQAAPAGGTVAIRVRNLSQRSVARLGEAMKPMDHILIDVSGTGPSMTPEVIANIYRPSFTTKTDHARMRLPFIWSIVQNYRGHMAVDNQGSTVRIYLPRYLPTAHG